MKARLSFIEQNGEPVACIEIADDNGKALYAEKQRLPSDKQLAADKTTLTEYVNNELGRLVAVVKQRVQIKADELAAIEAAKPAAIAKVDQLNETLAGEHDEKDLPSFTMPEPVTPPFNPSN